MTSLVAAPVVIALTAGFVAEATGGRLVHGDPSRVFASVSTGEGNSEPTPKYLATGPPEPSTESVRKRVDYYSKLKHGQFVHSIVCI